MHWAADVALPWVLSLAFLCTWLQVATLRIRRRNSTNLTVVSMPLKRRKSDTALRLEPEMPWTESGKRKSAVDSTDWNI